MAGASSKQIVITGATRGLGRAMTAEFIRLGHCVAGCGRSADHVATLKRQFGGEHDFTALDVRDDVAVRDWARRVLDRFGPPELLINNAAVIAPNAVLWGISAVDFDAVVDVNIKGVANVIRHFLPAMTKRTQGVIVNFSSGWGRSTSAEVAPYCASKWAIEGLSQAMAQEVPRGMAVCALNPGIIDTEMLRTCFGPSAGAYPLPDTWAKQAVPYLLSLGAIHNGQAVTIGE